MYTIALSTKLGHNQQTYFTYLVGQFVAQLPASTGNFTEAHIAQQKQLITNTYVISGTLCTPEDGDCDDGAIQLLVVSLEVPCCRPIKLSRKLCTSVRHRL